MEQMLPLFHYEIVVGFCQNTPASHSRKHLIRGPLVHLGPAILFLNWILGEMGEVQAEFSRPLRGCTEGVTSNPGLSHDGTLRNFWNLNTRRGTTTASTEHQWLILGSPSLPENVSTASTRLGLPHAVLGLLMARMNKLETWIILLLENGITSGSCGRHRNTGSLANIWSLSGDGLHIGLVYLECNDKMGSRRPFVVTSIYLKFKI